MGFVMSLGLRRRSRAKRLDATSAEVLLGAIYETSSIFYPWVVIEFYHTMTSRREPNPTTIHFTIDGQPGILEATDIAAMFNLPVVLANLTDYR